jgi:2,3-bisphosphoglycerate-independent phosphoglycerate mutase
MRILFIFMDGVGLGSADPSVNPFLKANTPNIDLLLSGNKLQTGIIPFESDLCTLIGLDARLGVIGVPQSATGQATLLAGINFAQRLGHHYGPKPSPEIIKYFQSFQAQEQNRIDKFPQQNNGASIFSNLIHSGRTAGFLNAYLPDYFKGIDSGKHIHSVIPLAAKSAGVKLLNQYDLFSGKAMSADFTGEGWREYLKIHETPVLDPHQAGIKLAELAANYDFSLFEFWASDYIGHKQDFSKARQMLETFDQVMGGLLGSWNFQEDLILVTSDHGNVEDLSTRKHTLNQVPGLLIGPYSHRRNFSESIESITDITPFLLNLLLE